MAISCCSLGDGACIRFDSTLLHLFIPINAGENFIYNPAIAMRG